MNPTAIVRVNWVSLVEKNAGFAIAFAFLLIGGILAFFVVKIVGQHVATLQNLIGNHMVSNTKAMKELCMSIKEHRREANKYSDHLLTRADSTLVKISEIKGKLGA